METKLKIILLTIFIYILTIENLYPCSLIVGRDGNKILVGANEDFDYEDPFIWFTGKTKTSYSCAFFGYSFKNDFGWIKMRIPGKFAPQQGINEKGLFFDHLQTPYHEISKNPEMKSASYNAIKTMMKTCATVSEAISFLEKHYFTHFKTAKIFLADSTGDYTIYSGQGFIRDEKNDFCAFTNFLESDKSLGNYPCERYQKANELYELNNDISVDNFTSILKAVHQNDDNLKGGTIYSNILNLQTGEAHLFYYQDFESKYTLNLFDEMKKGTKKIHFKNLFKKRTSVEITKTISKKGSIEAINEFHQLKKDINYNTSESELIFMAKAFYNSKYYKEANEIIELCLEKYSNSEFALELSAKIKFALREPKEYINLFVQSGGLDIEFANLLIAGEIEKTDSLFTKFNGNRKLFSETVLNTIGYRYLSINEVETAINLFKLNIKAFPQSSNAYDSLGEAYMINGDFDIAIENYTKSLELNPNNANAREKIKEMK